LHPCSNYWKALFTSFSGCFSGLVDGRVHGRRIIDIGRTRAQGSLDSEFGSPPGERKDLFQARVLSQCRTTRKQAAPNVIRTGLPAEGCGRTLLSMPIRGYFGVALTLAGWIILPVAAFASCHLPLPTEALRALDAQIDIDPKRVAAEVQRRINSLGSTDPLEAAELYVLRADALSVQDDDVGVRQTVVDARLRLEGLSESLTKRSLELRLQNTAADAPATTKDMEAFVDQLTQRATTLPPDSLEQACLLIVRSRLNTQLLRDEEATADALGAYRVARALHDDSARGDAAYQLAMTYLRAGLLDDAASMAEEAVAATRALGQTARLSNALYIQGNIFERMQRYEAALAALEQARQLNLAQAQTIDVAFDDQRRCGVLVALQQLDTAETICRSAETVLSAEGRLDLVSVIEGSLAQIDLLRRQPTAAVERLNRVLGSATARVPAKTLPKLYEYRAEALTRLGRFREALRDVKEAQRLNEAHDATHRAVASARLKERATTEIVQHERDALDAQMQQERLSAALREEKVQRRLALATVAILALLLIATILWTRARHERAQRRAAETLDAQAHILSTVREGVLLVDSRGVVRYTNAAATRLLGQPETALLHCDVERLGIKLACLQSMSSDAPGGVPAGAHELHLADAEGKLLTILLTYSAVLLAGEPLSVCVLLDVTALRQLERDVLADASGERGELSQQIHEGMAQDLAGIALLLSTVAGSSPVDAATLGAIVQHIHEMLIRARTLAGQISPIQVAGGSLLHAMLRLSKDVAAAAGINITSHCDLGGLSLTLAQADQIYRIAHDGVQLAVRDPGAQKIAIAVQKTESVLTITVASDGDVPPAETHDGSIEWGTVAYRARVIGGTAHSEILSAGGRRRVIVVPIAGLTGEAHHELAPVVA